WIGTFHGIAHRLLRLHWREANLPQAFQIMDAEDQVRAIRKLLKSMNLDEARWVPKEVMWFINARKDEGLRPRDLKDDGDPTRRQFIRLYEAYQEQCDRSGTLDFAELLLRAYELWRDRPDVLSHYRTRFRHILIDEFQDTNTIQYDWIKLLAAPRDCRSRSAMTTSRSTAGAAHASRTCSNFVATIRKRSSFDSSKTIARPATSWMRRTRSSATTTDGSARTFGRAGSAATRFGCTLRSTSETKRTSSSIAFATGYIRAVSAATARSSIARMRSRVRSKKRSCRHAFRI